MHNTCQGLRVWLHVFAPGLFLVDFMYKEPSSLAVSRAERGSACVGCIGSLVCFCMCLHASRAGHVSARLGCWT